MEIDKSKGTWYIPKDDEEKLDYQLDVIYQLYLNDWYKNDKFGIGTLIESQSDIILYYYHKEKGQKWGLKNYDMKYLELSYQVIRREKIEKILSRGN